MLEHAGAIAQTAVASKMGDVFDETAIRALPEKELTGVIRSPRSTGPVR